MGTLYDYLNWRGDLTFQEAPLNEVDSLIFALLSYIDFSDIVPETHTIGNEVPLQAAANSFFARNTEKKKISLGVIVPSDIVKILRTAKNTKRYRRVLLKAYTNVIDTEKETQFSAITFLPGDGTALCAFRGTDDTLIGWKENFNMSFMPVVPAQEAAVGYLNEAADHFDGKLRTTGHSKGGNLSVYAAVKARDDVRKRLIRVYCNDGPGFHEGFLKDPVYFQMRPIIRNLVPQSSFVGMLLEHEENHIVVKSRQNGLFQHDGLTWEVMGGNFVHLQTVTDECRRNETNIKEFLQAMNAEQREQFTEAIFHLFTSDHPITLTELLSSKNRRLFKSKDLDPQVFKTIQQTVALVINTNTKNFFNGLFQKRPEK